MEGVAVNHYRITATESVGNTSVTATVTGQTSTTLTGLKAATTYAVAVTACRDAACVESGTAAAVSGTTDTEYWQLQGTGNTVSDHHPVGTPHRVRTGSSRVPATR
ncbi:MAG: fibronectin type III domain-containing protein [Acidobacteriota bacterium]